METLRVLTDNIPGSNTAHTSSTDSICHCLMLPISILRVYSQYFGFCTFIQPELRVFCKDTAGIIGNILGSRVPGIYIQRIYYCHDGQNFVWPLLSYCEYSQH